MIGSDHEFQQDYLLGELPTVENETRDPDERLSADYLPAKLVLVSNTDAVPLVDENPRRAALMIQNQHASQSLIISFGAKPINNVGFSIAPGIIFQPVVVPRNTVYAIASGANTPAVVAEGSNPGTEVNDRVKGLLREIFGLIAKRFK